MITAYVPVPDFKHLIRVNGIYDAGSPGTYGGRWEDAEPPEPDYLEMTSVTVTLPSGEEIDLLELPPGVIDEAWLEDLAARALKQIRTR
jgi:hypothetical protein